MDGAFGASSGTWKAVKVDQRPRSQTALSIIHLMLIAASLPAPMQGRGCLRQPPATHALFGISINECTLGSCGPDQMGSARKCRFRGCGAEGGCEVHPQASQPSPGSRWKRSPAPSSLEMSMSMHVGKEAGSQCFGFIRTRHAELEGPYSQFAQRPLPTPDKTPPGHLAVSPMLEQSRSLWLFLHLVQACRHPVLCK